MAKVVKNYRNITWTLSYRHQRFHSLYDCIFEDSNVFFGRLKSIKDGEVLQLDHLMPNFCWRTGFQTDEVVVNFIKFETGKILITGINDQGLPIFTLIKNMYVHDNQLNIIGSKLITHVFDLDIHAYEIIDNNDFVLIDPYFIKYHRSMKYFILKNKYYIPKLFDIFRENI